MISNYKITGDKLNIIVAEEWLNEILENLAKESFNDIKKAIYGENTLVDFFSRNELFIFNFIKDFYNAWGRYPSAIEN